MNVDFPEILEELMQEAQDKLREHVSYKLNFTRECEIEADRERLGLADKTFQALFTQRHFNYDNNSRISKRLDPSA